MIFEIEKGYHREDLSVPLMVSKQHFVLLARAVPTLNLISLMCLMRKK